MPRPGERGVLVAAGLLLVVAVPLLLVPLLWQQRPRLVAEDVRALVGSTLQRESRAAFLVTGVLDVMVTTRVRNTRRLLPGFLDIPLGSAEATVRVPGRVSYGIRVSDVRAEDIRVFGDTVAMKVPEPRVYALEPLLEQLEVETEVGWLRAGGDAREEVQQRALELVRSSMRAQAERHLADSEQPRINSAETLHQLLRPAFTSAGLGEPVFRFQVSERLSYTGEAAQGAR